MSGLLNFNMIPRGMPKKMYRFLNNFNMHNQDGWEKTIHINDDVLMDMYNQNITVSYNMHPQEVIFSFHARLLFMNQALGFFFRLMM